MKADPRRGSFGSTALGSSTHFFGLQLGGAFGVPLEPVGYRGAAPVIADLSAGHIAAGCGGVSDFLTFHRDGKLRIVLTSGPRRGATTPEIPTIAELGHPDQASFGFYAFYAPAGTPAPVVAALRDELAAATMETEAKAQDIPYRLAKIPMAAVLRTRTLSETRGFMKALIDTTSDRILGFTAFGVEAGEVMASVQVAMLGGLPYTVLRDAVFTHPTLLEGMIPLFSAVPPRSS